MAKTTKTKKPASKEPSVAFRSYDMHCGKSALAG